MFENYQYGYMTPETNQTIIQMKPGQNIAGFPIGIIYIDCVSYPMLPGNVVNGYTYPFPVRLMPVEGLKETELFNTEPQVKDMVLKAALKLQSEGCRAVTGACGFFWKLSKISGQKPRYPGCNVKPYADTLDPSNLKARSEDRSPHCKQGIYHPSSP